MVINDLLCKTEIETQRANIWTPRAEKRGCDELGDWD